MGGMEEPALGRDLIGGWPSIKGLTRELRQPGTDFMLAMPPVALVSSLGRRLVEPPAPRLLVWRVF